MRLFTASSLAALTMAFCVFDLPSASANHSHTEIQSVGPIGGNGDCFSAYCTTRISEDGTRVAFETRESLVAGDTGTFDDIYLRAGGTTTLITADPAGIAANGRGLIASRDLSQIVFYSSGRLVPQDVDNQADTYEWSNGTLTLVSTGTIGGNGPYNAYPSQVSADGSRVLFSTDEALVPADLDTYTDVYERSDGQTTLLSTGSLDAGAAGTFAGATPDATHVFFTTSAQLEPGDSDTTVDVYDRSGSSTALVSTGPVGGNGPYAATFEGTSDDGAHVIFSTQESLVSADTDAGINDIYERSGGTTSLASTGPGDTQTTFNCGTLNTNGPGCPVAISADGSRVTFFSAESLVPGDTDGRLDIYQRSGGSTTLISTGPTDVGAGVTRTSYSGLRLVTSRDGTHVFFRTGDALTSEDVDSVGTDIYERANGVTRLVSTGPGTNGTDTYEPNLWQASEDGSRVFFDTAAPLIPSDTDSFGDTYERFGGETTLISTGPLDNGSVGGSYEAESPDGRTVAFTTVYPLVASDPDNKLDIYTRKVLTPPASYDTPYSASTIHASLVPMLRQTISTTQCQARGGAVSTHGAPLSLPSCNPPGYVPGTAAHIGPESVGWFELDVVPGDLTTPADEADVAVTVSASDVRTRATGSDYDPSAADVTLIPRFRLSDELNGSGGTDSATTSDFDFPISIDCTATADPATGSSCALNSSMDAVTPGAVREGRSMVIAAWKLWLYDSGTNAVRGDGDDRQFAQPGMYVQ